DGIRDDLVTGVQTCALPISSGVAVSHELLCRLYSPVAYQRERLGSRRGSRGLASLTVRVRPPISWPWSLAMAVLAAVPSGISTKDRKSTRLNSSHQIISYAV